MQFDELDKRIRDAAAHHHPAYDEQAWAKMHGLLDKHLPEKEERKRRFIIWFFILFLGLGGGLFYAIQQLPQQKNKPVTATGTQTIPAGQSTRTENPQDIKIIRVQSRTIDTKTLVKSRKGVAQLQSAPAETVPSQLTVKAAVSGKKYLKKGRNFSEPATDYPAAASGVTVTDILNNEAGKTAAVPVSETDQAIPLLQQPATVSAQPDKSALAAVPVAFTATAAEDSLLQKDTVSALPVVTNPVARQKNKGQKKSYFFLTFSAGPDISFAGGGKTGPVIAVTGAGIGYMYKNRISVRTGFYNADKLYSATPAAYNAPPGFYTYYPYLVKVDASCRVYEIPLAVSYHFGAGKRHSWFAGTSVSSYIMKRETYDYSYKTSAWSNTIQQRRWTLINRNQHLFSVLGLSAGYQYVLNKKLSFIAEPYFRMPLTGVGYGKVKLKSTGILFSLAVKPSAFFPARGK